MDARTGLPVVVNTSLNTAGRPMVDDPRDALECFGSAPVDLLAIGPFVVRGRTGTHGRAITSHRDLDGASLLGDPDAAFAREYTTLLGRLGARRGPSIDVTAIPGWSAFTSRVTCGSSI